MKKTLMSIITLFLLLLFPISVMAEDKKEKDPINVYLFWGDGCGYCEAAKQFFASIEDEYGKYFDLVDYEVWHNKQNNELKDNVANYFQENVTGVPYIIIGDETFGGYSSEYDKDIKDAIKDAFDDENYIDVVAKVASGNYEPAKNYDTLIVIGIFIVIIGGCGALIYFSRK